jgi:twitching motility two-component system response regulator PilG
MQSTSFTPSRAFVSPAKLIPTIANRPISGQLTFYDPDQDRVMWRVHIGQGQWHFATNVHGQRERLTYLVPRLFPNLGLDHLINDKVKFESDYDYLCQIWHRGELSLQQLRQLLLALTQDALIQLLVMPRAELYVEKTIGLDPILISATYPQLVKNLQPLIDQWAKVRPVIASPLQRPHVVDHKFLRQYVQFNVTSHPQLNSLEELLQHEFCIYELAQYLRLSLLGLATHLQGLITLGALELASYSHHSQLSAQPLVACIDDSTTLQRHVRLVLESAGYRVLELINPANALTELFALKPDLILMDILMPEVDGYELCSIIRRSSLLKTVPIVMLTSREGVIDRVRARLAGANEYLTKPFEPERLVALVRQLIQAPTPKP